MSKKQTVDQAQADWLICLYEEAELRTGTRVASPELQMLVLSGAINMLRNCTRSLDVFDGPTCAGIWTALQSRFEQLIAEHKARALS